MDCTKIWSADLFLLPSETESFGLAALEAMAFSVPVISSNTGGIPEVNIHGKSGFLSPVGDVESMANNAIQMLSDSRLHESFKSNAKNIVLSEPCLLIIVYSSVML